jgi:sugar phosphate isomerase/epimerase
MAITIFDPGTANAFVVVLFCFVEHSGEMRVGVLCGGLKELDWVQRLGFRSIEWLRLAETEAGPAHKDWKPFAEQFVGECKTRGLRISAIGALYQNPLDPAQTEMAAALFRRAIDVAAHIGVKTVAGFAGAVIEVEKNERGGNLVYKPFENYIPQLLAFWEPLARHAADRGVRIAFENCPQGPWHQPIMHYNIMGQPAMWECFFNATRCENFGLEWDPSHLLCQFIDPVANIHKFGRRIFHVHAKDAYINRALLETYGICHPGVAEHRFPGLGQANWAEIVHALLKSGYDSDLNIEGWHDPVYRDHDGKKLEDVGLRIARQTLERYTEGTE